MCNDCRLAQVIRQPSKKQGILICRFTMVVGNHMGVTPSHMICFPDLWLISHANTGCMLIPRQQYVTLDHPCGKTSGTQLTYVDLSCPGMESFATLSGMIACAWNPSRVTCIPWMLMTEMASQAHLGIFTWTCWRLSPHWAIIPHLVMKNGFRCQDWRIQ